MIPWMPIDGDIQPEPYERVLIWVEGCKHFPRTWNNIGIGYKYPDNHPFVELGISKWQNESGILGGEIRYFAPLSDPEDYMFGKEKADELER